jgi:hypothetical protein
MGYFDKLRLEVVVNEDDSGVFVQSLNDAMDRIEEAQTIFSSQICDEETAEPANADAPAAPAV